MATSTDSTQEAGYVSEERRVPSVGLILLAAGASTRMGRPKQLLSYGGRTLLRNAAEMAAASACRPILVVLGANAIELQSEVDDLPVQSVINERWAEGMGSSIQFGVRALKTYDRADRIKALVLMLCDQPSVTAAVIDNLVTTYHSNSKGIIASRYGGTSGVPALFGRKYFAKLATMNGAAGAKHLITVHTSDVVPVPFPKGITDIDTPEDYRQLLRAMDLGEGITADSAVSDKV